MSRPQPRVSVERIGREGEPIVTIDDFTGDPERLAAMGEAAQYQPGGASYPGIRAPADPSYLDINRDLMMQVISRVFGFRETMACELSAFSLVTRAPEELNPLQRIPHYDDADAGVIAVMHYLRPADSGGTAFYRHNRTGFEAITPGRVNAYGKAQAQDAREYGDPPPGYHYGDNDRYTLIGEAKAAPDRMVLYRGRLLHSGVIPDAGVLSDDPAEGRLTVNMFLRGR